MEKDGSNPYEAPRAPYGGAKRKRRGGIIRVIMWATAGAVVGAIAGHFAAIVLSNLGPPGGDPHGFVIVTYWFVFVPSGALVGSVVTGVVAAHWGSGPETH